MLNTFWILEKVRRLIHYIIMKYALKYKNKFMKVLKKYSYLNIIHLIRILREYFYMFLH